MRFRNRRVTKREWEAINILNGYEITFEKGKSRMAVTMDQLKAKQNKAKGIKLGDVGQTEQHPFISADELSRQDKFTIFGARLQNGRFGQQYYFDVAFKNLDNKIEKYCLTLAANSERTAIATALESNGSVTNCRLDHIETNTGNLYWKLNDADTVRPAEIAVKDESDNDDDIPF